MKFLYVDVKDRKVVGVFKNIAGNVTYLSKEDILKQRNKHKLLNSLSTIRECDEALKAMNEYKKPKRWWRFW